MEKEETTVGTGEDKVDVVTPIDDDDNQETEIKEIQFNDEKDDDVLFKRMFRVCKFSRQ